MELAGLSYELERQSYQNKQRMLKKLKDKGAGT